VVLSQSPRGGAVADGGSKEAEMAYLEVKEAVGEERDTMMTETKT